MKQHLVSLELLQEWASIDLRLSDINEEQPERLRRHHFQGLMLVCCVSDKVALLFKLVQ
jgi:hypothetical protein